MQKLVRDKIPKFIEHSGMRCNVRILDDAEYYLELKKKLVEEVAEFLADANLEELADIVEVVHALANFLGHTVDALDYVRLRKKSSRGSFEKRIFIESTDKTDE